VKKYQLRKLPPAIIVKSNRSKLQRTEIQMINTVLVFLNPRNSMTNPDIMQRLVVEIVMLHKSCLDSFSSISFRIEDIIAEKENQSTMYANLIKEKESKHDTILVR
jgi:hypothetical protein